MMMTMIVVAVVSAALLLGAAWGLYAPLGKRTEGFLVALAGGALLLSVTSELIEPSIERGSLTVAALSVLVGAGVFTIVDWLVKVKWGGGSGGGLLAAITLDGVPENLALGVALIGAGPMEVAALAGAILLSNLPEAAGGAKEMREDGWSKGKVLALWAGTAALLSAAALAGNVLLEGASENQLGAIRCFAAGAVIASLAIEVFPQAFKEDDYWAGIATAIGAVLAFLLGSLSGG